MKGLCHKCWSSCTELVLRNEDDLPVCIGCNCLIKDEDVQLAMNHLALKNIEEKLK